VDRQNTISEMPDDIKELIDDYMKEYKARLDIYESCLLEN